MTMANAIDLYESVSPEFPVPNLNGSSREDLIVQNLEALEAINTAIEKVAQAFPHGRDFQIGGDYSRARAQSEARLVTLNALKTDYEQIVFHLVDERDRYESRRRSYAA